MSEWLLAIGLLFGTLSTFRWLYKAASGETIGWWDTASFVFMGPVVGRVFRFLTSKIAVLPDWLATWGTPALTLFLMYWMLRSWKELAPKPAAIVSLAWLPILLVSILLFMLTNSEAFA